MAKVMSPLGKLMAKSCMKAFGQDLEDLRTAIESGDWAPSPVPA